MICTICDEAIKPGEPHRRHASSPATGDTLPTTFTHDDCRQPSTVVPFIASWESENRITAPTLVARLTRNIGYFGEVPSDRDNRDVLWRRTLDLRAGGRPIYGEVHPYRQRLAMTHELCQVCGDPADRDDRGVLWLLEDGRKDWEKWPNGMMTTHPPICRRCVPIARAQCPNLWRGSVLVRVGRRELCGVYGQRYTMGALGPMPLAGEDVLFEDPLIRWTIASQLICAVHDCTFVSLAELVATRP